MALNFLLRVISASLLLSWSVTTPALAQSPAFEPCRAVETPYQEEGAPILHVLCDGAAIGLGRVESYELKNFPDLNAAIAVTTFDGTDRIWMLTRGVGQPMLEEITGSISRMAETGTSEGMASRTSEVASSRARSAEPIFGSSRGTAAVSPADVAELITRSRAVAQTAQAMEAEQ